MHSNRSMPDAPIVPVLGYPDVAAAVEWLGNTFGFQVRLRIASHRAQLQGPDGGAIVVAESQGRAIGEADSVMVRVADVDTHHARAAAQGARVLQPPTDYPYGERQYTVADPAGHVWTFSQTIADVDPRDWGGLPADN